MSDEITPSPDELANRELFHERADRPRAALTRTDRELMLGVKEYDSAQGLRNAEYRLREHIRHTLHDLFLISNVTPQSELEQLLERDADVNELGYYTIPFHADAAFTLASRLSYIGAIKDYADDRTFEEWVESSLSGAIRTTFEEQGKFITGLDVDISVDVQDSASDKIIDEFVFGTPEQMDVISYLKEGDAQRLRERLRELDETISFAGDENPEEIGPDSDLFDMFISEDSKGE